MVGILRDQHLRDQGLARQPTFDQPRRGGRLHDPVLTGPAGVFGPAHHEHPELRRHEVEPLGDVFADAVQRARTARAESVLDIDHALEPRQMRGQAAAVHAPLGGSHRLVWRARLLLCGLRGLALLDLFEREQQLIFGQRLGTASEAMALQLLDDLAQPLALGALGQEQRLEHIRIIGERWRHGGHESQ
jgi:hypothetical protein